MHYIERFTLYSLNIYFFGVTEVDKRCAANSWNQGGQCVEQQKHQPQHATSENLLVVHTCFEIQWKIFLVNAV